jgi:hypothetical protein
LDHVHRICEFRDQLPERPPTGAAFVQCVGYAVAFDLPVDDAKPLKPGEFYLQRPWSETCVALQSTSMWACVWPNGEMSDEPSERS